MALEYRLVSCCVLSPATQFQAAAFTKRTTSRNQIVWPNICPLVVNFAFNIPDAFASDKSALCGLPYLCFPAIFIRS